MAKGISMKIRIGSRGSALALAQTKLVEQELQRHCPDLEVETVIIRTKGDEIQNKPLWEFGGKGVFITEIEEALQRGHIDLAVHSAKDMPMELGDRLVIAGVLPREDARDVLVTRNGSNPAGMEHPVIGTSSLRRQFQMKEIFPHAVLTGIRGNVPTRLQKLADGACDGVILAAAGLKRLGMDREEEYEYRYLSPEEMLCAGGQGIIMIEGRSGHFATGLAEQISDQRTFLELLAERKVLETLQAGCHGAIGVYAQAEDERLRIRICREVDKKIFRSDETIKLSAENSREQALCLAKKLAESLSVT